MSSNLTRRARLLATAAIGLVSVSAHADYVYGPPYDYNTAWGSKGGFLSVDAAFSSFTADYENACATYLTCKPHTFSVAYTTGGTAAQMTIDYVNDDGSTGHEFGGYIWATDVTGQGFQPKNAGGCTTMCTGGNGSPLDSLGPRGSSQDGGTKSASSDIGTSMEGDPINAANGNAYRQDTDLRTSSWLTFRRFYNSSSYVVASTMGPKWRHSFDRSVQLMPSSGPDAGLIYARRPDGSLVRFRSAGGVWTSDTDSAETLTVNKDPTSGVVTGYVLRVSATRENETYDASGRLKSITDDNGQSTTLSYSTTATDPAVAPTAGLLIEVTDPQGRSLNLRYDTQGRLASATDPAGQSASYSYGTNGNLSTVTYPDHSTRQYLYSEVANSPDPVTYPSELTGVIDEKGVRFETTTYDSKNHALSSQYAGGADKMSLYYYGYYQNGGTPASMTTPLGLVVTLNFADNGAETLKPSGTSAPCGNQCNQQWKSVTYDSQGYPASYTDYRGVVTTTAYDSSGLLTRQVEASGTDAQRTTSTTWDVTHRRPLTRAMSNAKGVVVAKGSWSYNQRGQTLAECVIDPDVTLTYTCGSQAHAPKGIQQTRYTYCDAVDPTQCPQVGLLLTIDGPRTDVTDLTRNSYYQSTDESGCSELGGPCHRAGDLASVTDAAGHVTSFVSYDRHGRPLRKKDANGVITDVVYTPRGWLASKTVRAAADGSPSAADATTTLTYEATGALKTVTDPDGVSLTLTYDDAHRLVDVADALGGHIHYTLDPSGNRTKEETFDSSGASRRSLSRKYNALGQLVSVTDGRGKVVFDATASGSYDANGNLVSAKDALGVVRKDTYDSLDRVISSIANANGSDAATKATTSAFTFDALDQIKSITDPDGLVTSIAFDGLGNPTGMTSPDTGTQSATYDAAGNPLTSTDAKGTVATKVFDTLGRTASVSYTDTKSNIANHFDESNATTGCSASFPIGHLTRVVENEVTTSYCYDNQGRVVEQRQTQGAVTDVTSYVYTKAGRLSAIASPSGLITEYTRDALGKIHSVVVTPANGGPASIVSSASYLPFGPLLSYTLGNGQTLTRTYDANYEVSDVSSPTISLHFSRDAAGNIVGFGQASGANPATESYTYDPLYRLTGVNDSSGHAIEAYTYSRAGDRLSKTASGLSTGAYSYQATTHWLTGIGVASRAYDQKGSMTANASAGIAWSYGYDLRGNLAVAQQGGVTIATYGYNAFAQRVSKAVGQQAPQRFVYADDGQLLFEGGDIARDYIWMDTVPVAVVDPSQSGVSIGFIHADGLGTPRSVTNEVGSQLWSWPFAANAFGELPPSSTTGFALSLRFPGQYFDTETSMVYNGNRYYDPTVGRYLQSDPLGMVDSPSTYAYVSSNPLAWVDPEGLANSGQWKQVPGTNSQVRMDPAHVEGQQPHVHVQTKGFPEVAINVDGTPSHSSDLSKMSRAKKLLKFLRSNGFAVKCLSGVQDVFFIRDIVSGVSAEQCEQGDIAACQTYQFLQGQDPADNVPHA